MPKATMWYCWVKKVFFILEKEYWRNGNVKIKEETLLEFLLSERLISL
jgi:hypothetical protein